MLDHSGQSLPNDSIFIYCDIYFRVMKGHVPYIDYSLFRDEPLNGSCTDNFVESEPLLLLSTFIGSCYKFINVRIKSWALARA